MVKVTDSNVKGAHDAQMALVGNYAYIVANVNDIRAGENPSWHEIYVALSIVNLEILQVEAIIPFARSGQSFENERLLPGSCFVPNIFQKDEQTLRCWFASEDPGVRQSQIYYIDFDLPSRTFSKTVHRMKMKTFAGVHDMQPFYYCESAWQHGSRRRPSDCAACIFKAHLKK